MSAFGRETRMQLTARQLNAAVVIAVEGALTASTARQFLRRARGLLAFVQTPRVAIDLSGVPRVDASGGAALIALLRHVQREGVMLPRLRIRRRVVDGRHVFRLEGDLDGSTACHALDVVARAPRDGRELEIDLSAVRLTEGFGLEVLSRGLSRLARQRSV